MACCNGVLLHVANAAVAEVPSGGNVPLGTTVCRRGCAARLDGDGITLAPGTYFITGTVTMAPITAVATEADAASAQEVAVRLLAGGSPVQGGYAATEATGAVTLPVAATVATPHWTTLTMLDAGAAVSVTNVSIMVSGVR